MPIWRLKSSFAAAIMITIFFSAAGCRSGAETDLEKALLAKDWQAVAEFCDASIGSESPSVLRTIKGHACIDLNRNNESLKLFISTANEEDSMEWLEWTQAFARKYDFSEVAHYLKGDARARRQEWHLALEAFNKALSLETGWHLALNARGVVHHAIGDLDAARVDFKSAADAREDFADAYASRGTLSVYLNTVKGAERSFAKAKSYSADSVLALNGLGCASYGKQLYEEARRFFGAIPLDSPLSPVAQRNAVAAELSQLGNALKKANDAGMNIERMEFQINESNLNALFEREPNDGPIIKVPDGRGGHYLIDANTGLIIGHVPAPNGQGEDEEDGKISKRDSNDGPVIRVPDGQGGYYIIDANTGLIIGREPATGGQGEDEEEGEVDDQSKNHLLSSAAMMQMGFSTILPPEDLEKLVEQTRVLRSQVEQQLFTAEASMVIAEPGGVDGNSVKDIGVNKGLWNVCNFYGMLYNVPTKHSVSLSTNTR